MAVDTHALHLENNGANSVDVRRFHSALFGGVTGPTTEDGLAVSEAGTPAMSVEIATGSCVIEGTESTYHGAYFCDNRGTATEAVSASDSTNARHDLVVLEVADAFAGAGVENLARLRVVAGTPAATPVDPATPENACVLARVVVPALASEITNADITDLRTFGAQQLVMTVGGLQPFTSATRPTTGLYRGRVIYEIDTKRTVRWDGSTWDDVDTRVSRELGFGETTVVLASPNDQTLLSVPFEARSGYAYRIDITTDLLSTTAGGSNSFPFTVTVDGTDYALISQVDWLTNGNPPQQFVFRRKLTGVTAGSRAAVLKIDGSLDSTGKTPFTMTVTEVPA